MCREPISSGSGGDVLKLSQRCERGLHSLALLPLPFEGGDQVACLRQCGATCRAVSRFVNRRSRGIDRRSAAWITSFICSRLHGFCWPH